MFLRQSAFTLTDDNCRVMMNDSAGEENRLIFPMRIPPSLRRRIRLEAKREISTVAIGGSLFTAGLDTHLANHTSDLA